MIKKINKNKYFVNNSFRYENYYNDCNYVDSCGHIQSYIDICKKYTKEDYKWLDVGCGAGKNLSTINNIIKNKNNIFGLDIVDDSIKICHKLGFNNCIKHSIIEKFPYKDNIFDFISGTDILEHLTETDIEKSLKEISRVSKKSTYLLLASSTSDDLNHVHLTIKNIKWWKEIYKKHNFTFIEFIKPYGMILRNDKG